MLFSSLIFWGIFQEFWPQSPHNCVSSSPNPPHTGSAQGPCINFSIFTTVLSLIAIPSVLSEISNASYKSNVYMKMPTAEFSRKKWNINGDHMTFLKFSLNHLRLGPSRSCRTRPGAFSTGALRHLQQHKTRAPGAEPCQVASLRLWEGETCGCQGLLSSLLPAVPNTHLRFPWQRGRCNRVSIPQEAGTHLWGNLGPPRMVPHSLLR